MPRDRSQAPADRLVLTRAAKVALSLIAAAFVVSLAVPGAAEPVAVLVLLAGHSFAGITMLRKARRLPAREGLVWKLIGVSLLMASTGVLLVGIVDSVVGSVPAFSTLDLFFFLAYAFLLTGLGVVPGQIGSWRERAQTLIDSALATISIGTLLTVVLLEDIWQSLADAPSFDRWVGMTYPILDVAAVVSIAVVFVKRRQFQFDYRFLVYALALTAQGIADVNYVTQVAGQSFGEVDSVFPFFILASFLFVATSAIVDWQPQPRELSDRRTPLWSMLLPYGATFFMVVLLISHVFDQGSDDRLLLVATLLIAVLAYARQALAIYQNRILVDQERNSLISSLSHELRTPLTSLVGFLSLLDDEGDLLTSEDRIEMISTTRQQADYMGRMVTDLVMLSRDDLDQTDILPSEVKLEALVERALVSADLSGDKVTTTLPAGLILSIDADRIQQVTVNLLANAHRYGDGRVAVVATPIGHDLELAIHDNGTGVPKKHHVTMWERFERAHHRFDASLPGSGIGLAIVAALVRAHGGKVGYRDSELLGGACFTVHLPGVISTVNAHRLDEAVARAVSG